MSKGKRSLVLVALVVAFLVVVTKAHAQEAFTYLGVDYGDWEAGGIYVVPTAPGGNEINWQSNGSDVGQGITGMSSDTPDGSNWSVTADGNGWDGGGAYNLSTYIWGYTAQTGYSGQYLISYDYKGDIYTSLGAQGGEIVGVSGIATVSEQTDTWTHTIGVFETVDPGVNGFSFYVYDNTSGGRAAYMDNLSITPYIAPPPRPAGWFPNSEMEDGGSPTTAPDYWGGGPATITGSTDLPTIPGDGYQSLSILGSTGLGSSYVVAYGYDGVAEANTEYELSFWHKGDVYTSMPGVDGATVLIEGAYEWTEEILTVTTDADTTGLLSLYFYDWNFTDELPLLIDNVYFGPAVAALLEGDANRDGIVSAGDYTSVQNNFGNNGAADGTLDGDANADGVVSAGDYTSVQNNFGNHLPEPMTMSMLGLGGLALLRRRRR